MAVKLSLKNVRLSRFTVIGMIVVGVALVGWVVMELTGVFDPPKSTSRKQEDSNRCPYCNRPLTPYDKQQGECQACHGELATKKAEAGRVARGRIVPILLIGAFCLLVVVNVAFLVRSRMVQNPDDALYYMNCRKCTRKVRFRQRQIGQFARCPICKTLIRFPEPPDMRKGRWARMKDWLRDLRKKKPVEDSA